MVRKGLSLKKIRFLTLLALTIFTVFCYASGSVTGLTEYSSIAQNCGTVVSPSVILQNGNVGTSTIYANDTSAETRTVAPTSTLLSYDYVLRITNLVTNAWKIRLQPYAQNNIGRLSNCTISFHNSTGDASLQILIANGNYSQQTGLWCDLKSSATTYVSVTLLASDPQSSQIYAYLEVLTPNRTTYAAYILTFTIT